MVTFGCSAFRCVNESFFLPNRQGHLASVKGSEFSQHIEVLLSCQQRLESFPQAVSSGKPCSSPSLACIFTSHPEMSLDAVLVGPWQGLPARRENLGARWGAELDAFPLPMMQNCFFLPSWQVADCSHLFPAAQK